MHRCSLGEVSGIIYKPKECLHLQVATVAQVDVSVQIIWNTWKSHLKILTCCIFCFEFVVFLLPSLLGLLDELGDCEFSEPDCPLILGRDTELLRELRKEKIN